MRLLFFLGISAVMSSCAQLYHVQMSNIESTSGRSSHPIEVKVSEYGIDVDEAASWAKSLTKNKQAKRDINEATDILKLFQMGPKTGVPIYNEDYAKHVGRALRAKCRYGKIVNVISIREAREYPVIKGEIVKIKADCVRSS